MSEPLIERDEVVALFPIVLSPQQLARRTRELAERAQAKLDTERSNR